jgi:hypothetical protein
MSTLVDQARKMADVITFEFPGYESVDEAATTLRQLADRVQELEGKGQPVGEAGSMPGTSGFTMACFKAEDVPLGTKLYASPPSSVQPEKEECRPLTDEQIDAIAREVFPPDPIIGDAWSEQWDKEVGRPFARAIEAAHGISPSPSMVGREGDGK